MMMMISNGIQKGNLLRIYIISIFLDIYVLCSVNVLEMALCNYISEKTF